MISTSEIYREILYTLFKKEKIATNISTTMFSKKLRYIKECNAISFYISDKLSKELLDECLTLYITHMIDGWDIKKILVENG